MLLNLVGPHFLTEFSTEIFGLKLECFDFNYDIRDSYKSLVALNSAINTLWLNQHPVGLRLIGGDKRESN